MISRERISAAWEANYRASSASDGFRSFLYPDDELAVLIGTTGPRVDSMNGSYWKWCYADGDLTRITRPCRGLPSILENVAVS